MFDSWSLLTDMDADPNELPLDSRDALRVAALFGEDISLPLIIEMGIKVESLDPLFDRGILLPVGTSQASFASEELRESTIANISWSQKRRWSLELAQLLERNRGNAVDIARHYLAAQDYVNARGFLIKAAEQYCLANEYHEALRLLGQAFEIWPPNEEIASRRRVLREMARCAGNTGDVEVAGVAWEELLEMSRQSGDVKLQIDASRQLADLASMKSDRLEVKRRLHQAALLSSEVSDEEQAVNWYRYAQFLADYVKLKESIEASEKAINAAERACEYGLQVETMALSALVYAMSGNTSEADERIERAIAIAIKHELPSELAIAYRRKANVNEYSCNYVGYLDIEMEALDRCRKVGESGVEQACVSCLSYAFFRLGQWKQSTESFKTAIDEMKVEGELLAIATSVRSCVAAFRGERKQADALTAEALRLIGIHGGIVLEFYVHWARGLSAMLDGRVEDARAGFSDLVGLWRDTDDRKDAVPGLVTASMFYADQNDQSSLSECIDILNTILTDNEAIETRAAWNAAMAEGLWSRGQIDKAIVAEIEAVEDYEKQGLPTEIALVSRRLALMYASAGDIEKAESVWRRSIEIAKELGMRPLLERLEMDRQESGVVSAKAKSSDGAGLTSRQLDVLQLVASGLTNKEAASKLGLSPRTVEMHMAGVLERLNCRARTDAIKKATQLGIV